VVFSRTKLKKKNEQDDTSVATTPATPYALCYQQYLKYRGDPSIATVQRWQLYKIYYNITAVLS